MTFTFTDIFCGAGGSSIGLASAGMELLLAANHWPRAIETHAHNFTDAEHLCADVNNYDMRRLPTTDILWASPICTEASPAGGRSAKTRRAPGQGDLLEAFGAISQKGFERTRATFHDVIRATEVHRYRAVLIENVPDVASRWEMFDWWIGGMTEVLGYNVQYVSVSSAHVGGELNPHAPQWRDRLYLVFTRKGIPLPDVDPRPIAWCQPCQVDVAAVQAWKKPGRRIGKYRQQYVYVCPNTACRNAVVDPYVMPAAAAIDWSDLGARIGDRATPLAEKTIARIRAGLAMFANRHTMITVNHGGHDGRARPADEAPLPSQTVRIGDGMVSPPMLVPAGGTWNDTAAPVDDPMRTRTAREAEALVTPGSFLTLFRSGRARNTDPGAEPLATLMTSGSNHALVTPEPFLAAAAGHTYERPGSGYRRVWPVNGGPMNTRTGTIAEGLVTPPFYVKQYGGFANPEAMSLPAHEAPLGTQTTSDSHSLITPEPFIAVLRNHAAAHGIDEPLRTMAAGGHHHALVIPYRRGNRPTTTGEPLHTLHTRDSGALVQPAVDVEDCWFRMLKPREQLRAQRFPDSYVVLGNVGEQTMQAGNAVSANVAQWLGERVIAVL